MRKIGYLRISTKDQKADRQIQGMQDLCDELYIEQISAGKRSRTRPIYNKVMRKLVAGDMLVVWDVDRAFRSTVDAINEAKRLIARDIHFKIVNLQVDTSTAHGMLIYTIISAFAEHERANLIERTKEGIEAARRNGKQIGRPFKLTARQINDARRRVQQQESTVTAMAKAYEVSRTTLSRALNKKPAAHRSPPTKI